MIDGKVGRVVSWEMWIYTRIFVKILAFQRGLGNL